MTNDQIEANDPAAEPQGAGGSGAIEPRVGSIAGGKYKIVRLIGQGAMGNVYEAQNVAIGKRVALKFVHMDAAGGDAGLLARFHREARAVGSVESAHIVQVFDTGETEAGEPFLVMELLQGESLAAKLARDGAMPVIEAVDCAVQALRGLRRAHGAGIVHRDLKPENLLLVTDDDDATLVKIVDFGLSKFVQGPAGASPESRRAERSLALTQEGALVGTPLYMSPEQMEARSDVDTRTDVWSMGAILFEALAGEPPFPETSYARLVLAVCEKDAPDVRSRAPQVPPALAAVVAKALSRDRARRFASADDFIRALLDAVPELARTRASGARPSHDPLPAAAPAVMDEPTSGERAGAAVLAVSALPAGSSDATGPTVAGATMWVNQPVAFSLWRGDVGGADRLRIEARDGNLHEVRLEPVGVLKLGRADRVGDEQNHLVYPDVASRLAAVLRHDGTRWWLKRRDECSVPVQVGARSLSRNEEAPLVHGVFVLVGGMRATFFDRRYMTPTVPAGAVDPATGLLGRAGLEQETSAILERRQPAGMIVAAAPPSEAGADTAAARAALVFHRLWPSAPCGVADGAGMVLFAAAPADLANRCKEAENALRQGGGDADSKGALAAACACGFWVLSGGAVDAGREVELALSAAKVLGPLDAAGARIGGGAAPISLRDRRDAARVARPEDVLSASIDARRATLLFAIEEQAALRAVGAGVLPALEQELSAVVAARAGQAAMVAKVAPGVVAASVPRKTDATAFGGSVQVDWHARPPVMDGKMELWRTLSWEVLHGTDVTTRATELSRECNDPHGVLSALAGGLPYPIAGRVLQATNAASAIERVKMLFDVLEGTWRFIAVVLVAALFAKRVAPGEAPPGFEQLAEFYKRNATRDGLALGTWRELSRTVARAFPEKDDPVAALAREMLDIKLTQNQTFEELSNLMQAERNSFAHGHYNEARAAADITEFEQMTRTFLRALRPLCAWTLVTVERTEPDLYGDAQTVEYIDHTGPFNTGTRRRIGWSSPARLANVVYLARFRDGLVLPLEPMVRRMVIEDKADLFWMDHLPRPGSCHLSLAVGAGTTKAPCDVRRLPPVMRMLIERAG